MIKYDLSDENWDKANYECRIQITTCNYTYIHVMIYYTLLNVKTRWKS